MAITPEPGSEAIPTLTLADFEEPVFHISKYVPSLRGTGGLATEKPSPAELQTLRDELSTLHFDLAALRQEGAEACARLQQEVEDKVPGMSSTIEGLMRDEGNIHKLLLEADAKTAALAQAALLHGNRLRSAMAEKEQAIQAIRRLNHLQMFAHATSIPALPALFHDETRLGEAGATARGLLKIVQEVVGSLRSTGGAQSDPAPVGSIEAALARLEEYCGLLDTRIVARFDAAVARNDYASMASCSKMLVDAKSTDETVAAAERPLVQRYISTRPLFTEAPEALTGTLQAAAGPSDGAPTESALGANAAGDSLAAVARRVDGALRLPFKSLLQTVIKEAVVMEQAFRDPHEALTLLIVRVFEQRVSVIVDAVVGEFDAEAAVPSTSYAARLHMRLSLLTAVTQRTWDLAADLKQVLGGGGDALVAELAEAALVRHSAGYLDNELAWLEGAFAEEQAAPGPGDAASCLQLPAFVNVLTRHREALERAASRMRLGLATVDAVVRLQGETLPDPGATAESSPATLLAQACVVLETGLRRSEEREGLEAALGTVSTLSAAVELLWEHYSVAVQPLLPPHSAPARACAAALGALQTRLDGAASAALGSALDRSLAAVRAGLRAARAADSFAPADAGAVADLDRPTAPCRAAAASLHRLLQAVCSTLHGENAEALVTAVMGSAVAMCAEHMEAQVFSPLGALVWRRDLQHYEACLFGKTSGAEQAPWKALAAESDALRERRAALEELQALTAVLCVAPDALPGLIPTLPDPDRARQVVALRADYATAIVRGQHLADALAPVPS